MSSETPSTAFTTCRERRNNDPPDSGKWTLRSLVEINGCALVSITLDRLTLQKPHSRNDRASNARALVPRREEIRCGKAPPRDHIAGQTDIPAAISPGPAAIKSSGWQERAIAIITRWRMPPENSCG